MDYITVQQAAEEWEVSDSWIQRYLRAGRIEGAVRFGHAWMIPKGAEKPEDRRKYNHRHPKKENSKESI
jgi:excisionase family DNA binding protein